jgi:hypothetical protein
MLAALPLPRKRHRLVDQLLEEASDANAFHTPPSQRMPAPGVKSGRRAGGGEGSGAAQGAGSSGAASGAAAVTAQGLHMTGVTTRGSCDPAAGLRLEGSGGGNRFARSTPPPAPPPQLPAPERAPPPQPPPPQLQLARKRGAPEMRPPAAAGRTRRQHTRIAQALQPRQAGSRLQFSNTAAAAASLLGGPPKQAEHPSQRPALFLGNPHPPSLPAGGWGSTRQAQPPPPPARPASPTQSPPFRLSLPCVVGSPKAALLPAGGEAISPASTAAKPAAGAARPRRGAPPPGGPAAGLRARPAMPLIETIPPTPAGLFDFSGGTCA